MLSYCSEWSPIPLSGTTTGFATISACIKQTIPFMMCRFYADMITETACQVEPSCLPPRGQDPSRRRSHTQLIALTLSNSCLDTHVYSTGVMPSGIMPSVAMASMASTGFG